MWNIYVPNEGIMKISVKVPATTANLGPGFDCLGMALPLYNIITIEETVLPGTGKKRLSYPFGWEWTGSFRSDRSRIRGFGGVGCDDAGNGRL